MRTVSSIRNVAFLGDYLPRKCGIDGLSQLKMAYPKTTAKRRRDLEFIRKPLTK